MDIVHLMIEDEEVMKLRAMSTVEPTFEIHHKGKVFPCNPIPAVESAHFVFEGYNCTKALGFLELHNEDKKHLLPSIIGFLHGKSLLIEPSNAAEMREIAQELGMPLIEEYARNCIFSEMHNQFGRDFETNFIPESA